MRRFSDGSSRVGSPSCAITSSGLIPVRNDAHLALSIHGKLTSCSRCLTAATTFSIRLGLASLLALAGIEANTSWVIESNCWARRLDRRASSCATLAARDSYSARVTTSWLCACRILRLGPKTTRQYINSNLCCLFFIKKGAH